MAPRLSSPSRRLSGWPSIGIKLYRRFSFNQWWLMATGTIARFRLYSLFLTDTTLDVC